MSDRDAFLKSMQRIRDSQVEERRAVVLMISGNELGGDEHQEKLDTLVKLAESHRCDRSCYC